MIVRISLCNHQPVLVSDIVGINRAAHAIGKILNPRACGMLLPSL